jgi:signal transduction histidine kinase
VLPEGVDVEVFRIVQEAVANASRHAGASRIAVSLSVESGNLAVDVDDDGCGFTVWSLAGRSIGLDGMRERATRIGAALSIRSAPGAGTSVGLILPMRQDVPTIEAPWGRRAFTRVSAAARKRVEPS